MRHPHGCVPPDRALVLCLCWAAEGTAEAWCARGPDATPVVTDAADSPMQFLYSALDFGTGDHIDSVQLSAGLRRLGARRAA